VALNRLALPACATSSRMRRSTLVAPRLRRGAPPLAAWSVDGGSAAWPLVRVLR
jgi:hypothetical protein